MVMLVEVTDVSVRTVEGEMSRAAAVSVKVELVAVVVGPLVKTVV